MQVVSDTSPILGHQLQVKRFNTLSRVDVGSEFG